MWYKITAALFMISLIGVILSASLWTFNGLTILFLLLAVLFLIWNRHLQNLKRPHKILLLRWRDKYIEIYPLASRN